MGVDFPLIGVVGFFDAGYYVGLERVPFFEQLVYTFRICAFNVRQTL